MIFINIKTVTILYLRSGCYHLKVVFKLYIMERIVKLLSSYSAFKMSGFIYIMEYFSFVCHTVSKGE